MHKCDKPNVFLLSGAGSIYSTTKETRQFSIGPRIIINLVKI